MWRDFELILNSWRDFELICFREDSIEVEGLVKTVLREGSRGMWRDFELICLLRSEEEVRSRRRSIST